ncbi:peptidase T [Escherichia coli]|nr:peptidase T [Escherichia coli]
MATLPANVPGDIPAIGFISHVEYLTGLQRQKCESANC